MNREDYIAVACRLFAIYLLVLALQFAASAYAMNAQQPGAAPIVMMAAVVGVMVLVAAGLWLFPLSIARALLPVMKDRDASQPLTAPIAFGVGLMLVGVWLFAQSLNTLVYFLVLWAKARELDGGMDNFEVHEIARLVSAAVVFLLSLALMFGSRGIRDTLLRLRYGRSEPAA